MKIKYTLGIEDLAANAFIEQLQQSNDNNFVSYTTLKHYGECVLKLLQNQHIDASIIYSREYTNEILDRYSDFFVESTNNKGELGIQLQPNITIQDLRETFRGYLGLDVLLALINKKTIALCIYLI